jgi:hypothetical protein
MTSAGRQVPNKKLYGGSPRVFRNFPIGSHAHLAFPTEPSGVVMEHCSPLLRVPTVSGFGIVFEGNMAPRRLGERSNEFLASIRLVIVVLNAREQYDALSVIYDHSGVPCSCKTLIGFR